MATLRTGGQTLVAVLAEEMSFRALVDGRTVCSVQADWTLEHVHQILDFGIDLNGGKLALTGFLFATFQSLTLLFSNGLRQNSICLRSISFVGNQVFHVFKRKRFGILVSQF